MWVGTKFSMVTEDGKWLQKTFCNRLNSETDAETETDSRRIFTHSLVSNINSTIKSVLSKSSIGKDNIVSNVSRVLGVR